MMNVQPAKVEIGPGDIVTVKFDRPGCINTYKIDTIELETALISHPLAPQILQRVLLSDLNKQQALLKDSVSRGLDYAKTYSKLLSFDDNAIVGALAAFFVINRFLCAKQKGLLSTVNGKLAVFEFKNDINAVITFIKSNEAVLDSFNLAWYARYKSLFSNPTRIEYKNQRIAIFNIAGFVLSELSRPVIQQT